jgi:hypothetical protein
MRTRVQRGRVRLRELFEACCRFEFDARGAIVEAQPHATPPRCGC